MNKKSRSSSCKRSPKNLVKSFWKAITKSKKNPLKKLKTIAEKGDCDYPPKNTPQEHPQTTTFEKSNLNLSFSYLGSVNSPQSRNRLDKKNSVPENGNHYFKVVPNSTSNKSPIRTSKEQQFFSNKIKNLCSKPKYNFEANTTEEANSAPSTERTTPKKSETPYRRRPARFLPRNDINKHRLQKRAPCMYPTLELDLQLIRDSDPRILNQNLIAQKKSSQLLGKPLSILKKDLDWKWKPPMDSPSDKKNVSFNF